MYLFSPDIFYLFFFLTSDDLNFYSSVLSSTLLRFTKRFVCASPFTGEYIDRSSERPGREFGLGGPKRAPPLLPTRCRSNLRVETGPRDRRSKYWDTGTLSPRSFFGASFADQKKRKRRSRWRKERIVLVAPTSRALHTKILPFFFKLFISLVFSLSNFYNIPLIIIKILDTF